MNTGVLLMLVVVVLLLLHCWMNKRDNFTSGYAVTSGLAYGNRMTYCDPGNEAEGGAYSGGCFIPHRVIF